MDTWVLGMVRSRCSRRVSAWVAALACVSLLVWAQRRYVRNFLMGPYSVGAADLDAIRDVSEAPRYFVKVTGSKVMDTGVQQLTVRKRGGVETSRSVSAGYYALLIGDRLLLCKSTTGARTTYEGEISAMPVDLSRHLFNTPEMQEIRGRFYPYSLSEESFRLPGYVAIGALLVFGFLLGKHGLPAWRRLQDPATHPVVERVQAWGDPIGVAAAAEAEARAPRYKSGDGWALGDQYLIQRTFFTFDLLRVSDLLWAYKKVTKHSVNFIPTGKTYEAVLVCYGGAATIQGKEALVDDVLTFAAGRTPWAIFGFSQELAEHFSKNTAAFCGAVEQRKREAGPQPAAST